MRDNLFLEKHSGGLDGNFCQDKHMLSWVPFIFGQAWGLMLKTLWRNVEFASMLRGEVKIQGYTNHF